MGQLSPDIIPSANFSIDDADAIKTLLTRLTGHGTFPNVFIEGHSIGGYDDLKKMLENDELIPMLAGAGVATQHDAKDSPEN